MKKITLTLGLALASSFAFSQARVQAIHNCADNAAATVDLYLNGTLLLDDLGFQEASPYIDAPAGVTLTFDVCAPNSTDNSNPIFTKDFNLVDGEAYAVVASGGLGQTGATAFDLRAYSGQEGNPTAGNTGLKVIHGSYDAPEVNIYEANLGAVLAPSLNFGDDAGYLDLAAQQYAVQVRLMNNAVVGQYTAPLTGLADQSAIAMATGFVDPSSAAGTEAFGVMAVLEDGTVLQLPTETVTPARLQVIHNCAATDAASVDVWLNDGPAPLIDDFSFRTATPYIDAPAGASFDVSIALPTSTDTVGALYRESFLLESSKTYVVIASGLVGSGAYSVQQPFDLIAAAGMETSTTAGNVDVLVVHGSTDAPTVDVNEIAIPAGIIVDDISYGQTAGYLDLPEANFVLNVEANGAAVASYNAPLADLMLADNGIIVLASGFLNPAANNNGEAFGLFVALPGGGALVPLQNVLSIEEENIGSLGVYPNPTNDFLNLKIDDFKAETVEVYALSGSLLKTFNTNEEKIFVGDLENGMYILRANNGTQTLQTSFIVK
jgi:hypothetical protein